MKIGHIQNGVKWFTNRILNSNEKIKAVVGVFVRVLSVKGMGVKKQIRGGPLIIVNN